MRLWVKMTLACCKGALNEAYPLTRRPDFVPHAKLSLFWDGEVPSEANLRRKPQLLLEFTQLILLNVNALRFSHELADIVREGYSLDSFIMTRVSGEETFG
jgi:hypothetical protein